MNKLVPSLVLLLSFFFLLSHTQVDLLPPDIGSWKDVHLDKKNHNLPLIYNNKNFVLNSVIPLLQEKGYINKERPSLGCGILKLLNWYKTLNSSMETELTTKEARDRPCHLKQVLVYSEKNFGGELLSSALMKNDYFSYTDYSFNNCKNRTSYSFSLYNQLLCSLQLPACDVSTSFVGVDRGEFWGVVGTSEAIDYPAKMNIPVVLLVRQNSLSWHLEEVEAGVGREEEISQSRLVNLVKRAQSTRMVYGRTYCLLKGKGVKVMVVEYEDFVFDFRRTMRELMEFLEESIQGDVIDLSTKKHKKKLQQDLGDFTNGWWRGLEMSLGLREERIPLEKKIKNAEEVREMLVSLGPEYLCLLEENCQFPEFECGE